MSGSNWRAWLLCALVVAGIVTAFCFPPLPQDPAWSAFADRRTLLGVPNFWNVVSNLPFVLVGTIGWSRAARVEGAALRRAMIVFSTGVVCVAGGSTYFHLSTSMASLVFDRLPMTVVFMTLLSIVIGQRISERVGERLLWPLILIGAASVVYWYATELLGHGDLRAYALVQFLPLLLIPAILILYPSQRHAHAGLWSALGLYALAKAAEHWDAALFVASGCVSGHTLKHVLAALAVLAILAEISRTRDPQRARL